MEEVRYRKRGDWRGERGECKRESCERMCIECTHTGIQQDKGASKGGGKATHLPPTLDTRRTGEETNLPIGVTSFTSASCCRLGLRSCFAFILRRR